jgi:hypothetical protein
MFIWKFIYFYNVVKHIYGFIQYGEKYCVETMGMFTYSFRK